MTLKCIPAIIALETSPSHLISSKALGYHTLLYNKHATMINARHLECARKSFEYQQRLDVTVFGP
jgi:cohesin loading factor subunit SCC2